MQDRKVVILMSTYNGEKYIEEQMESIFNQTYKNIEIFVRDDGSTDNTVKILKKYEEQRNINIYFGNNIGHERSYYWLVENTKIADYYSFADQDDVWFSDKIEKAVNVLNNNENKNPNLYFCDFDYYDKDLLFLSHKKPLKNKINLPNVLVNNINWGFTSVINNKLRDIYLKTPFESSISHDYLILLIGYFFGNVIYDKYRCAKYRLHGNNVSMNQFNFIKHQIWRINKILLSNEIDFKERWNKFYNIYENILSEENKNKLNIFVNRNNRFNYQIKKIFYFGRYRDVLFDEIAIRFLFILGRL